MTETRIYTALVTFERADADATYLPPEAQGACGYMAIVATDEDNVFDVLRSELSEVGLTLVDAEEIAERTRDNFPEGLDARLAENVRQWRPGKRTAWGTLHAYLADGET